MKKRKLLSMILLLFLTGCSGQMNQTAESPDTAPASEWVSEGHDTGVSSESSARGKMPDVSDAEEPENMSPADPLTEDIPEEASEELTALADEICNASMSEYEKVKAIHDYLVIHVNYDYDNLAAGTLPRTAFTVEGALLLHSAVCEGYAKAFSWLCRRAGLEEQLVYGTANDGTGVQTHAWNQVRVDGEWYYVDVTWDDPLMNGQIVTDGSNIIYEYFLVPDMKLLGNHTAEDPESLHACTSDRYLEENRRLTIEPYLTEPCSFAASDTEIQDAVEQYLSDGIQAFQLICDVTYNNPEGRAELVLNKVKDTMTARGEYGQISVETRYGIADYAVIDITITR